jgi:acyl carrier protein
MELKNIIRCAVAEVTGRPDIDDQNLLENGIIDSFGILQLITALEEKLKVRFNDEDLAAGNFRTVDSITALLVAKQSTR